MVEFDCPTDSEWFDIAGMVGLARIRPLDAAVRQPTLVDQRTPQRVLDQKTTCVTITLMSIDVSAIEKGNNELYSLSRPAAQNSSDLLLVVLVMSFSNAVIQQPLPDTLALFDLALGLLFVVIGLTPSSRPELGLFPLGENLARAFVHKGSSFALLFAFALGFGSTVAEPALIAVAARAAIVVSESGLIENSSSPKRPLRSRSA